MIIRKSSDWLKVLHIFILTLTCAAMTPSVSAENSSQQLDKEIENYGEQIKRLQEDYESTRNKRRLAEDKLSKAQRKLASKQEKIAARSKKTDMTQAELDALDNEQKRLELAELGIVSQQAALQRLQEKEDSLAKEIEASEAEYRSAKISLVKREAAMQSKLRQEVRSLNLLVDALNEQYQQLELELEEAQAQSEAAQNEVRMLAEENAQLRALVDGTQMPLPADVEESQALESAQAQEQLEVSEQVIFTEEPVAAQPVVAPAADAGRDDLSQQVLPGELPIYEEARDSDIILRSRSLDESYPMREIAKNVYETEVTINPGTERAYFDVAQRRYRGRFPDLEESTTYIFTFNRNDRQNPKMKLRRKSDEQIVTNSEVPL